MQVWAPLGDLAELHGLKALLFDHLRGHLPPDRQGELPSEWEFEHLVQSARNACALHQLDELAAVFRANAIPAVVLKGGAALGTIPGSPAWRRLDDLDILVPEARTNDVGRVLEALGYRSTERERTHTSLAERQLAERRREHLAPYVRDDRLPLEIHVNLMRRARREAVLPDVWQDAEPFGASEGLLCLRDEHFVIHTAVHYIKHLESGFAPLKSLVDLVHMVSSRPLDWELIQDTAERWGVWREIATVLATLRDHWSFEVPLDLGRHRAIPLAVLATGRASFESTPERDRLRYQTRRILRLKELPDLASRAAYVAGLVLPDGSYLRRRYQLGPKDPLLPVYIRHFGNKLRGVVVDTAACILPGSSRARVR